MITKTKPPLNYCIRLYKKNELCEIENKIIKLSDNQRKYRDFVINHYLYLPEDLNIFKRQISLKIYIFGFIFLR